MTRAAHWSAADIPPLEGRSFIVTGANSGIGLATAELLGEKQARVVLACRDEQRGRAAVDDLRRRIPQGQFELELLDLASQRSIGVFARRYTQRYQRLDALINNAGVIQAGGSRTEDGHELEFGVNFLGPFALTGLLMPVLSASPGARVVTVSSIAHWLGRIDFDKLDTGRGYSEAGAYAQSKLADLIFAYELHRRLLACGSEVSSIGAHPGGSQSQLIRKGGPVHWLQRLAGQPATRGALPSLRAATDPAAGGGEYYGPDGFMTLRGAPVRQNSSRRSRDAATAARLWALAEKLTGVRYP